MPSCPHGSEPKEGAPPYTWINYRDLLGCNGGDSEPWYCSLIIDIPNLLNFRNTQEFCSSPQPPKNNISENDLLFNAYIPKLIENAEHNAWSGICQCKVPPPPDENEEPPASPYDKPFQVEVPNKPECSCNYLLSFWGGQGLPGQKPPAPGRVPQALVEGALYSDTVTDFTDFPTTVGNATLASYTFYAYDDGEPPDKLYYQWVVSGSYSGTDLQAGILNIPVSADNPWAIVSNDCDFCPVEDPELPPGLPPPTDACCPVDIPEVPDLTEIYQRLDWLEAAIANLPLPIQIGTISVETEEIPYGVYERVEDTGGGEE